MNYRVHDRYGCTPLPSESATAVSRMYVYLDQMAYQSAKCSLAEPVLTWYHKLQQTRTTTTTKNSKRAAVQRSSNGEEGKGQKRFATLTRTLLGESEGSHHALSILVCSCMARQAPFLLTSRVTVSAEHEHYTLNGDTLSEALTI